MPSSEQLLSTDPNAAVLLSSDPAAGAAPPEAAATPSQSGAGITKEQWDALPSGEKARAFLKWGGNVIAGMTGMNQAGAEAVEHPGTTLALAAIPHGAKLAKATIPSKVRAGAKFQEVMGAARDIPIDVEAPGKVALRIYDLAQRGGSMPKAVRDFLKRVTDPELGPMTYQEARDFAHNISRLSANEWGRLTPVIGREVGSLRVALNQAVEKAARQAGKGDTYTSAMKEYARRAKLDDFAESVWKGAKKSLPFATAAAAGAYGARKLSELLGRE